VPELAAAKPVPRCDGPRRGAARRVGRGAHHLLRWIGSFAAVIILVLLFGIWRLMQGPIELNWLTPYVEAAFQRSGIGLKMAISGVLVFFPVLVNSLRGLTSVRPGQIELMHSYAAGELQIFRLVRLPSALPFIFSGLKVGTVLAMIGAIVGDYFGGSQDALGILIRRSAGIFDFKLAWAAIVVASIFGMLFYAAVAALERVTLRSHVVGRGADI